MQLRKTINRRSGTGKAQPLPSLLRAAAVFPAVFIRIPGGESGCTPAVWPEWILHGAIDSITYALALAAHAIDLLDEVANLFRP
jgi:hypothetical protein